MAGLVFNMSKLYLKIYSVSLKINGGCLLLISTERQLEPVLIPSIEIS